MYIIFLYFYVHVLICDILTITAELDLHTLVIVLPKKLPDKHICFYIHLKYETNNSVPDMCIKSWMVFTCINALMIVCLCMSECMHNESNI